MLADQHGPGPECLTIGHFHRARIVRAPAANGRPVPLTSERLHQDRACARADVADFNDLLAPRQDARHERLRQGLRRVAAHDGPPSTSQKIRVKTFEFDRLG